MGATWRSLGRVEPGAGRHEPPLRRVRARPAVGHHPAGQRGHQRHPGQRRQLYPAISADGRYVAFESGASNLVPGDTNHRDDVFVRDLRSGTTRRVSVAADGSPGQRRQLCAPAISADGRYVAFVSLRVEPGARRHEPQRRTCSCATGGRARPSGSAWLPTAPRPTATAALPRRSAPTAATWPSSRRVEPGARRHEPQRRRVRARPAVGHHPAGQRGHQRQAGQRRRLLPGDQCRRPLRGLRSSANLVPVGTNDSGDVFVRDRRSGTTRRVSRASDGTPANQRQLLPGDQRRRPLRDLLLERIEPGARRHERQRRRVRARLKPRRQR